MARVKFNEKSFLVVKVKVKEEPFQDEQGNWRKKIFVRKITPDEEISLGSAKNPNKDILWIEYREEQTLDDIFGGLFGKRK